MSIHRAVAAVAAACLLALAAPAHAAPPASAQRFADAALRMKQAIKAQRAELERRVEELDFVRCFRVFEAAPARHDAQVFAVIVIGLTGPMMDVARGPLEQMVRDLDAIPTQDPALRSGRAAWRAQVAQIDEMPRVDAPCDALERWRDAKWRASAAPKLDERAMARMIEGSAGQERKVRRAARRLRQLGVRKGEAARFTGDTMFDNVIDDRFLEAMLGSSDGRF